MAIIRCAGCDREISDKAAACPQCGRAVRSPDVQAAASRAPHPASPTSESRQKPTWIVWVGIIGFVLLVITCSRRNGGTSNSGAGLPGQGSPAQKTLAYWRATGDATNRALQADQRSPQAVIAGIRQAVGQIRSLPAVDVDPDAIQCGNDVATVLGNLADFTEQSNNPGLLVESFLRGMAGDPLGTLAEQLNAQSALGQQLKQVQTELDNARAILSSRYGVEFPRL